MFSPFRDLTKQRFVRLSVLRRARYRLLGRLTWLCRCDCGKFKLVRHDALISDSALSCGCLRREYARQKIKVVNAEVSAEWRALVETLLEVVTRFPQRRCELYAALRETWGSCGERRFDRALATLVTRGLVERQGKRQGPESFYLLRNPRRHHAGQNSAPGRSGTGGAVGRGEAGDRAAAG